MWNRSVKGNYSNVPLDLDLEHDNKMVKEAVKKLNGNITEKSVNKIVKSQAIARGMLESFDRTMHIVRRSGKHLLDLIKNILTKYYQNLLKKKL